MVSPSLKQNDRKNRRSFLFFAIVIAMQLDFFLFAIQADRKCSGHY
jgi:hypothetical protein